MSRVAQFAAGLFVAWLLVFVLLLNDRTVDREIVGLWGILPVWGPLLLIAALSAAVWLERRIRRRRH